MKKRADGRYQKNVYVGTDESGKKKYKSVFGLTQKEVNKKATEIKIRIGKGLDVFHDDMTFEQLKDTWLLLKKPLLKPAQYKNYVMYLKHFEMLYEYKINKLTATDFQQIITNLFEHNPNTGKPTAKKTLRDIRASARQVFDFAIKNRILEFNPLNYVEIPSEAPRFERRALTEQEQNWILTTKHRGQLPAMIMMLAGLRLGECLGLQWCDINIKNKTINVHQRLIVKGKAHIEQGAKSKCGVRLVNMPDILVDYLAKQPEHLDLDFVVSNAHGNMMSGSSWRTLWTSYIKELNVQNGDFSAYENKPRSRFDPKGVPFVINKFSAHYLRHTCATNLFYCGHDLLYVQEQLGHAKPETTLNIYTHLVKSMVDKDQKIICVDDYLKSIKTTNNKTG